MCSGREGSALTIGMCNGVSDSRALWFLTDKVLLKPKRFHNPLNTIVCCKYRVSSNRAESLQDINAFDNLISSTIYTGYLGAFTMYNVSTGYLAAMRYAFGPG